jgi:hypothetical protein
MGSKSGSGIIITSRHSVSGLSVNEAIGHAISVMKRPAASPMSSGLWDTRDEPCWHDVNTLLKLADYHCFSNLPDIKAAFSLGFTAHRDLVVFRNYYGHRNLGTKTKAQNLATTYGIKTNQHPTEILLDSPLKTPGITLLDQWVSELEQTITFLCA